MSDGHDETLVLDAGYLNLRNVNYVDVVEVVRDLNPSMSVSEDKMRRIWESITYSMNHYESEGLKAKKLEEMNSSEAKRYWHDFGLKLPAKPGQEPISRLDRQSCCGTCGQSAQQMPPSTRPLQPPPGFDGNSPNRPQASINRSQHLAICRPSRPQPVHRTISPIPPLTQTAHPFSMSTVSLPEQATSSPPSTKRPKHINKPSPPRPSFSQTAQPFSLFTVLLPGRDIRPLSFATTPSSSQAALQPLVSSRPRWPLASLSEHVVDSVSADTSPICFFRPRTHRRLWVPPSAQEGFTLRTRTGDVRVGGGS